MLQEIEENEFQSFAESHPLFTFHQTKEWASLKQKNGWEHHYVFYQKGKKKAAALLLMKPLFLGKVMCYSPRGFLLDYEDQKFLASFTDALKKYLKEKKAIFVKIDPPLLLQERDIDGHLVENGKNHKKVVSVLKSLGYIHYGFSKGIEKELQPRWVFALSLDKKSEEQIYENFDTRTKRSIKKCEREGIFVREMKEGELPLFKAIMEHTANRRGFLDRPFQYYQNMVSELKKHCSILLCFLDVEKAFSLLEEREKEQKIKQKNYQDQKESKKKEALLKESEKQLNQIQEKKEFLLHLQKERGNQIILGGSMFLQYGKEKTYLFGGSYQEFMQYPSQYYIQWKSIQMAKKQGCKLYNFYGIDGNFESPSEMHGIYEFKRGFDGEVREYIGEFDLPISKTFYRFYRFAFPIYKKMKKILIKKKN